MLDVFSLCSTQGRFEFRHDCGQIPICTRLFFLYCATECEKVTCWPMLNLKVCARLCAFKMPINVSTSRYSDAEARFLNSSRTECEYISLRRKNKTKNSSLTWKRMQDIKEAFLFVRCYFHFLLMWTLNPEFTSLVLVNREKASEWDCGLHDFKF